jgi:hypothetical protein
LDTYIHRLGDFPHFQEYAESLACHDQPRCILRLIEKVLRQSHWNKLTRKIMACLEVSYVEMDAHDDIADDSSE